MQPTSYQDGRWEEEIDESRIRALAEEIATTRAASTHVYSVPIASREVKMRSAAAALPLGLPSLPSHPGRRGRRCVDRWPCDPAHGPRCGPAPDRPGCGVPSASGSRTPPPDHPPTKTGRTQRSRTFARLVGQAQFGKAPVQRLAAASPGRRQRRRLGFGRAHPERFALRHDRRQGVPSPNALTGTACPSSSAGRTQIKTQHGIARVLYRGRGRFAGVFRR